MKVTLKDLVDNSACETKQVWFIKEFGEEVEITPEVWEKYKGDGEAVEWVTSVLLGRERYLKYLERKTPAAEVGHDYRDVGVCVGCEFQTAIRLEAARSIILGEEFNEENIKEAREKYTKMRVVG